MELPTREVLEISGYICVFDIQRSEYRESTIVVLHENTRYAGIIPSNFLIVPDSMCITRRNNTLFLHAGDDVYRLRATGLQVPSAVWICILLIAIILVGFLSAPTDLDLYTRLIRKHTRHDGIPEVVRSLRIGSSNQTRYSLPIAWTGDDDSDILQYVIKIICICIITCIGVMI
jgi:hypothetical protein